MRNGPRGANRPPHTSARLVHFSIAIFAKRQLFVPKFQKLTIVPCVGRHLCNAGRRRARQWSLKKEKGSYPARTRAITEVDSTSTPTLLKRSSRAVSATRPRNRVPREDMYAID